MSEREDRNARLFAEAVRLAVEDGFLQTPGEEARHVWAASAPLGWAAAARHMAANLPGTLTPAQGPGGVMWKCGNGPAQGNVIAISKRADIHKARALVASIIPEDERPQGIPWSLGACARRLLVWSAKPQVHDYTLEPLIGAESDMTEYMYHDCQPGVYPFARMWDCQAYFFALMLRLPSLRVSMSRDRPGRPGALRWDRLKLEERERWGDVLAACRDEKVLRNSLWGASLGSMKKRTAYTSAAPRDAQGKRMEWEPGRVRETTVVYGAGPFRPAALVLARGAAELCRIAAEEVGSVYSTVDSVTTIDDREPLVWVSLGLPCAPKYEGPADIVGRGDWRIGPHCTMPYIPMKRIEEGAKDRRGRVRWERDTKTALDPAYTSPAHRTPAPRPNFDHYYYRTWV